MAISYTEKGSGLHTLIASSGYNLYCEAGVWLCSDEVAVQAIIDAYPLSDTITEVKDNIDLFARAIFDKATATNSAGEMAGWGNLRNEYLSYIAGATQANCKYITAESTFRNVTFDSLVSKIAANVAKFDYLRALIAGKAGFHKDAVSALATFDGVLTYNWTTGWPEI